VTPTVTKRINSHDTDASIVAAVLVGVLGVIPLIVSSFSATSTRNHPDGDWLQGSTIIYRGPGKSKKCVAHTGTTLEQSDQRRSRYHRPDG